MTTVAKIAGAVQPSCRASRYGRSTSPARAGSSAERRKADDGGARTRSGTASARAGAAGTASGSRATPAGRRRRATTDQTIRSRARLRTCAHTSAKVRAAAGTTRTGRSPEATRARYGYSFAEVRGSLHNISGSSRATAGAVAYGCGHSVIPVRCRASSLARHHVAARRSPARNAPQRPRSRIASGKVRDIFDLGDALLIVATDRISAFDYVLGSGIPDKGKVLTQLSAFWFERTARHRAEPSADRPTCATYPAAVAAPRATCSAGGRCWCARRTRCRSSAWRAATCRVGLEGIPGHRRGLRRRAARRAARIGPAARRRSSRRPRRPTAATTSTSAKPRPDGSSATDLVARLRELTLGALRFGAAHAEARGIILADTKFEFGLTDDGRRSCSSTK